jgi:TRAP-type C4-dicarboxylate transport system substrate-binding protein
MNLRHVVCAALLGASLASATVAQAEIQERKLRFSIQNTMDHPLGLGAQKFADLVSWWTGRRIPFLSSRSRSSTKCKNTCR